MGRTWRRNSDDWPKRDRRNKRRNHKKAVKGLSNSGYNRPEEYADSSYLEEYDNFERFTHGKRKGK